jgi:hypothetical protein
MKKETKSTTSHAAAHTATSNGAKHAAVHAVEALPTIDPPAVTPPAATTTPSPPATSPTVIPVTPVATPIATLPSAGPPAASTASAPNILTMLIAQAAQNVSQATAAVANVQTYLPGLVSLPAAQRKVVGGRFRDGEGQVLLTVLEACTANPTLVASLADEDNGVDPTTFETTLLSSRIQLAMLLAPLSATLSQLASNVDDTVLYLNELTKGPTLEAYAILKAVAKTDLSIKTAITPALDFYSNMAKAAVATKKKNAAAKLAAQAAVPVATPASQPPPAVASAVTTK